ncbi:MAG: AAA family ATPase [Clostridiales bacterium]|nr:AAA family ATPase [Clostridiales bacterium]
MTKVFAILSGKGGTGKTTLAVAIGAALAKLGNSTVIIDGNMGYRNCDMLFGAESRIVYDLKDLLEEQAQMDEVLVHHQQGLKLALLPAAQSRIKQPFSFKKLIDELKEQFAFILIDCPGREEEMISSLLEENKDIESIVITSADRLALRDTEKIIDLLWNINRSRPSLVINQLYPSYIKEEIVPLPSQIALHLDIPLLGYISYNQPLAKLLYTEEDFPLEALKVEKAFLQIAKRLMGQEIPTGEGKLKKRLPIWHFTKEG